MHSNSEVPFELKSHRFQELDSLRGLAAFTVVLSHFLLVYAGSSAYRLITASPLHLFVNGPQAVILFFVLSGFVLSSLWGRNRADGYAAYCLKRLLRLCLPFYAALLLAAALDRALFNPILTSNAWINETWSLQPTFSMLLHTALTGLRWAQQFNTAFWTVTYEIRISLLFPLLYWGAMRIPTPLFLLSMLAIQAALPALHKLDGYVEGAFVGAVAEFAVGVVLYRHLPWLLRKANDLSTRQRTTLALASLLLYAIAVPAPSIRSIDVTRPTEALALHGVTPGHSTLGTKIKHGVATETSVARLQLGILGAAGILVCAIAIPGLRHWLHRPFLLRIGSLSYSTYLLHGTVLFVLIRTYYGRFPFIYLLPVYLLIVYAVSEPFHWIVDRPSILLGRRVGRWLAGGHLPPQV